jgi:cytochrome c556
MGMQAMQNAPATLMGKMPDGFRALGMPTHMAFDQIAQSVQAGADPNAILTMLAKGMNNCVACHASYRIEPATP